MKCVSMFWATRFDWESDYDRSRMQERFYGALLLSDTGDTLAGVSRNPRRLSAIG
jgi:hypothetical protein